MKLLRIASFLAICAALSAQGVDEKTLLNPPPDSWPGYHGDYSGQRHSRLTQITPQNVDEMGLAWAFQTNQTAAMTRKRNPKLRGAAPSPKNIHEPSVDKP